MPHRCVQLLLALGLLAGVATVEPRASEPPAATAQPTQAGPTNQPAAPAVVSVSPAGSGSASSPKSIRLLNAILLFLVVTVVALVLFSIATRVWREAGERRRERFRVRWEPMLYGRLAGDDHPLPPLTRREHLMFLILWLHMQGYVRGEALESLVQAGHDLGLSARVLRLLESRSYWKRVVAMRAAGALRLQGARATLIFKIAQNRPKSSLAAARALIEIDPQQGFTGLRQLLRRLDWSPGDMVEIVKAAGPQAVQMLAGHVLSAPPGRATQIVRLIELTGDSSALPALRERLLSNRDGEEIAVILHALGRLGGAEDRMAVLKFLTHANWLVRMQSACALGSLGTKRDCDQLVPLVRDGNWWVRYRAAQSLLRLMGAAALDALRDGESDAYAREMIERVLAEGG